MSWFQREIQLPSLPRGCHLVTRPIVEAVPELASIKVGLMNIFLQHTSASLTINENADPDVPIDLADVLDALASEDFPYRHTIEGPDDMPAHVKTSLTDSSLTIPIRDGHLCLGTWQGIFLWEHRHRGGRRKVIVTLNGEG